MIRFSGFGQRGRMQVMRLLSRPFHDLSGQGNRKDIQGGQDAPIDENYNDGKAVRDDILPRHVTFRADDFDQFGKYGIQVYHTNNFSLSVD